MALAVTTSPAHVEGAADSSTVTTAPFNVPAGAVLVIMAGANSSSGGSTNSIITTSDGKTVTDRGFSNFSISGVSGFAQIATAVYPDAATGITVTLTTSGSTSTTREPTLDVFVVTGAHLDNLIVSSGTSGSTTNNPTFNRTGTIDGVLSFVFGNEWNNRGLPVTATGFDVVNNFNGASCDGSAGYKAWPTAGAQSYTLDAAGALSAAWNVVRVELRPATTPTVDAGADHTQPATATFNRTAVISDTGGQEVTATSWRLISGPDRADYTLSFSEELSWQPTVPGTYVVRFSATNSIGTTTDDVTVVVTPVGVALYDDTDFVVEVAFGADLEGDPDDWDWVDITPHVRQDPGINWRIGQGDEASTSQPASCSMILDNDSGDYSLGGLSRHWPYVRPNTPVRVLLKINSTYITLFQGGAVGFTPGWDSLTGKIPVVELSAAGTLRRLARRGEVVESPMRRFYRTLEGVVGYWPMEDGKNATELAQAVGPFPMRVYGRPSMASDSENFPGSKPLPKSTDDGNWSVEVDFGPATGFAQVNFLLHTPAAVPDGTVLCHITLTGTMRRFDITYENDGDFGFFRYDNTGALIESDIITFFLDDNPARISVKFTQNGSDVTWRVQQLEISTGLSFFWEETDPGYTFNTVQYVDLNPNIFFDAEDITFGHLVVANTLFTTFQDKDPILAFKSEIATGNVTGRLKRITEENGIIDFDYQAGTGLLDTTDAMGEQPITTVLEILRECEAVDRGLLFDGYGPSLSYRTRRYIWDRDTADLTLDAAQKELAPPYTPVDDDQRTRNYWKVDRKDGAEYVAEDIDGPLGTSIIGLYDDALTVNVALDSTAQDIAWWLLNAGTIEGYRFPSITVNLLEHPELRFAAARIQPGKRIEILNVDQVLQNHPPGVVALVVVGVQGNLSSNNLTITYVTAPAAAFQAGKLAELTGDFSSEVFILDSGDDSTLGADVPIGTSSMSVATVTGGALWSTDADDYPMEVEIAGIIVTVTAVTGSSSPQTFTVDSSTVTKTLPSGSVVSPHHPGILGR